MKLITPFLILFLIISIKSESSLDSYSIEKFKDHIKDKGLLELIKQIKKDFGQDADIISCEELNQNNKGNCKKFVTEYMPRFSKFYNFRQNRGVNYNNFQIMKQSSEMFDIKKK